MTGHPVLVGYGSPDSAGAVQLGGLLASVLEAPVVLAGAYGYEPGVLTARADIASGNRVRVDAAMHALDRARRLLPPELEVEEQAVPALGVDQALVEAAREADAVLLSVGRDLRGDIARRVVRQAPCPVVISPMCVALVGQEPIRSILVADDGSAAADLARTAAQRLGERCGAEVHLLHVTDGDPGRRLLALSREHDLIACGSHGRGRALSALVGSVSAELVRGAACPVLVVPPGVAADAGAPLGVSTAAHGLTAPAVR